MHNSAFKFHNGKFQEYNALEYFFNLKDAKSQLKQISDTQCCTRESVQETTPDSNFTYEIFNIYRNKICSKQK